MFKFSKNYINSVCRNKFFLVLIFLYSLLLLLATSMACYFSFSQKKEELMSQIESTYAQLALEYRNITDNFWQLYMPIFETQTENYDIWKTYFSKGQPHPLNPFEKQELESSLRQMLMRVNDVKWIVLYNADREDNYILYGDNIGIVQLSEDFPYMEALKSDCTKMEIYGTERDSGFSSLRNTYAICSRIPSKFGVGKIMTGYDTSPFYNICKNSTYELKSLNFILSNCDQLLFDYKGSSNTDLDNYLPASFDGLYSSDASGKLYIHSEVCGRNTSFLSYYASFQEMLFYCHSNTPILFLVFLLFALVSLAGYILMLHMISKEVNIIRDGLTQIGQNDLNYQLPIRFQQSDLSEIASSINQMTLRLKENINRAYYYELKQREAELSELQAKFNPHFLYNTLEMLRSRCEINGDPATADLITQLASIFRGFIGSKTFIPMTEELTSSKRYLALFGARYENKIEIRYDFDKEILSYGIIRNLFQPLIENYFVHGFDTSNKNNYILFSGKSLDSDTMVLTVEDNGSGMTPEEISALNAKLHEPVQIDTESYGLKNLHQRLHLFYGGNCGLTIYSNPHVPKGVSIQIIAKKMTVAEVTDKISH